MDNTNNEIINKYVLFIILVPDNTLLVPKSLWGKAHHFMQHFHGAQARIKAAQQIDEILSTEPVWGP